MRGSLPLLAAFEINLAALLGNAVVADRSGPTAEGWASGLDRVNFVSGPSARSSHGPPSALLGIIFVPLAQITFLVRAFATVQV